MRLGRLRDGNVTRSSTTSATSSGRDLPVGDAALAATAEPGGHRARHDVADADVVVTDFLHQRLAERVQTGLRRAVRRPADERVLSGQAADVDDPAAAAAPQVGNGGVTAVEHAAEVRVDASAASAAIDMSATFENTPTPALLTRMSRPPNRSTARTDRPRRFFRFRHVGSDGMRRCVPSFALAVVEMQPIAPRNHDPRAFATRAPEAIARPIPAIRR